jgi:hypothetical protein
MPAVSPEEQFPGAPESAPVPAQISGVEVSNLPFPLFLFLALILPSYMVFPPPYQETTLKNGLKVVTRDCTTGGVSFALRVNVIITLPPILWAV